MDFSAADRRDDCIAGVLVAPVVLNDEGGATPCLLYTACWVEVYPVDLTALDRHPALPILARFHTPVAAQPRRSWPCRSTALGIPPLPMRPCGSGRQPQPGRQYTG